MLDLVFTNEIDNPNPSGFNEHLLQIPNSEHTFALGQPHKCSLIVTSIVHSMSHMCASKKTFLATIRILLNGK